MIWFVLCAVLLRLATLAVSIRNEKRLKAEGAVEFGATNSSVLALAHVAFYVAAAAEGFWRAAPVDTISYLGFALYAFGMVMLLVVIRLLGRWWTVKLILARDHQLVQHPLFSAVRHPNYYLNILPELVGFALALHAYATLIIGLPCYLVVLAIRIRLEDQVMKGRFDEY
ncbi:isoprenylcysteine carboxyl methyltransferase family protein [Chelatococcus sp. GCM10030263]|uniref:isoprenylcysteine carboxyl methyltransferase family protein n=1 Tax=Chelatococcus sp. GCM10030263 TaxID=3273387 RepID=UPI003609056D